MHKLLFLLCCTCFFACSNESSDTSKNRGDTARNTPPNVVSSLPDQSEMEILGGCVDNARNQLGEQQAYALCKCVLGQVQQKYPGADSTAIIAHLSDTAQVAQMAKQCQ